MTGKVGMIAVLMMASFIGTTIGMAGNFMSELKVAHMTGATPRKWNNGKSLVLFFVRSFL